MNSSIKYGLIGGLIYVILQMAIYLIDPTLIFSWTSVSLFMVLLIILFAVCGVYAIRTKRYGLGGFIKFKEAFTEAFITVVVMSILINVFSYLLYAVIDPSLEEQLKEFTINSVAGWMEESVPEEQFDEVMAEMEDQDFISPMTTITGSVQFIVIGAIVGAITSAIMKKEDPEEAFNKANQDTINL